MVRVLLRLRGIIKLIDSMLTVLDSIYKIALLFVTSIYASSIISRLMAIRVLL